MSKRNFFLCLALALLALVPQGVMAQQREVTIDPTSKPVSYADHQRVQKDQDTQKNPMLQQMKNHRRLLKSKGQAKQLKEHRSSLNNLLQKHAPIQINAEKLRKAAKAGAKVPFKPDNNHKYLIVNVVYNSLDENMDEGLFALDIVTGELTLLSGNFIEDYENYGFNGGAYIWNGKYRGVFYDDDYTVSSSKQATVMEFNMDDWSITDIFDIPYMSSMALECGTQFNADGTTSVLGQYWGVDGNNNLSLRYATLDDNGMTTTTFGNSATKQMLAMGVTNDGRLYGVAKDGNLYRIDRTTGEEILIGYTGITDIVDYKGDFWLQSGEIDPADNTFYWMAEHASVYWTQLCTINLQTGKATPLIDFQGDVQSFGMVIAPQQRKDETPAAVTGLTATFGKLETTGSGSFVAPTVNFAGQPLAADAQLYYNLYVNDVKQTVTDNQMTPGATVNFTISSNNVKNNGENLIKVTVSLGEDGEESVSASTTAWVGYGIPQAPKNVAMTFDEATNTATITWEAPAKGENAGVSGGFIDKLCYSVYRLVDGERKGAIPNGTNLADDVTSVTYTLSEEDMTMTIGDLSFAVEAASAPWGFPLSGLVSEAATTNSITAGKGKETPYFVDFANNYYKINLKDFTIINSNNDDRFWTFCPPHYTGGQSLCGAVACPNYKGTINMDDWFITPGIALQAGKTYHYKSYVHGPTEKAPWFEHGEVWIGTDRTAEAMTIPLIPATLIQNYMYLEADFTVPEDGNYYFGTHSVSAPDQWEIALFDIYVGEKAKDAVDPLSPVAAELTVTPIYGYTTVTDENEKTTYCGSADIKVTLPTNKVDGSALADSELMDVKLTATDGTTTQTLAEYTAQAKGSVLEFKAENMPSGEYTFNVQVTYTVGDKTYYSPLAVNVAYLGWDNAVAVPTGMKAIQSGNKLVVQFQEQNEPKGAHNAYLPSFSYRAYSGSKAAQITYYAEQGMSYIYDMIEADAVTNGLEIPVSDFNPQEGAQYNWQWYVLAVSKDATGKNIYSKLVPVRTVIGEPIKAPAIETGEQEYALDGETSNELNEVWAYYQNYGQVVCGIQPIEDQFGFDVGKSWNVFSAFNGDVLTLFRKVDISTLSNPVFSTDIILEDPDISLEVLLRGPDGKEAVHPLTVMDGIQHINIPLDEYKSWGWVQPTLKAIFHIAEEGDRIHDLYFDNAGIYDMQPCNLAVISFEATAEMKSGEESMVNVTVMNLGQQAVSNYTVSLVEDEMTIQSKTLAKALKPGEVNVVQFRYMANTVYADDLVGQEEAEKVLVATVDAEGDGNEDDNMAEAVVSIAVTGGKKTSYPSNVVAQQTEGNTAVNVTWSFDFEETSQVVTESFEDYELWYTGGVKSGAPEGQIGIWKLYDGDNKPTYTWEYFDQVTPYAGEPQAYQVFNGDLLSMSMTYYYYNFDAISGEKFLVSMDPADGNYTPQPDDWLISPRIPGGSSIEFYYGALVRKAQGLQVYYSETGQDISDFKLLKELDDATGDEWSFAYVPLPETAKYFAIRHSKSSHLGYGVKIDDITYNKITSIDHFNIYVDGQLMGTSTEAAYTVNEALESGKHKIAVTAVFADGTESVPAYATLDYQDTGIRELLASGKPFDVYSVDGKLVRKQTRSTKGLKGVYVIDNRNVLLK